MFSPCLVSPVMHHAQLIIAQLPNVHGMQRNRAQIDQPTQIETKYQAKKRNTRRKALNAMNQRRPEGRQACIFGLRALVLAFGGSVDRRIDGKIFLLPSRSRRVIARGLQNSTF